MFLHGHSPETRLMPVSASAFDEGQRTIKRGLPILPAGKWTLHTLQPAFNREDT